MLSYHPTGKEIGELAGKVAGRFKSQEAIIEQKNNLIELADDFDVDDEQQVERARKVMVDLANLLNGFRTKDEAALTKPNDRLIAILADMLKDSLNNVQLLITLLLLIARLTCEGKKTREKLRESSIPETILQDIIVSDLINYQNIMLVDLCFETL